MAWQWRPLVGGALTECRPARSSHPRLVFKQVLPPSRRDATKPSAKERRKAGRHVLIGEGRRRPKFRACAPDVKEIARTQLNYCRRIEL